jgi:Ca2+-binding EF-hand superfamily protein
MVLKVSASLCSRLQEHKKQKVVTSVKEAFEAFDKDHSGFIDKNEVRLSSICTRFILTFVAVLQLASLANELGETLDEEEVRYPELPQR